MSLHARARHAGRLVPHFFKVAAGIAYALLVLGNAKQPASAASINTTVEQSLSIPLTQTNWAPGIPASSSNPLIFNKFDASLGQLLSVNLTLESTFDHNVALRFVSPSTLTMQTSENEVSVYGPDGSALISAVPSMVNETRTVTNGDFPQSVVIPIVKNASSGPLSITDPATLAMFTAASPGETIALPATATSSSAFSSDTGNGSGSVNTLASATVLVSYTYVPEPSTILILGLGFAACGRWASRRRLGPTGFQQK